jgi:hypothetical protein
MLMMRLRLWNSYNISAIIQLLLKYFLNNFVFSQTCQTVPDEVASFRVGHPLLPASSLLTAQSVSTHSQSLTTGFSGINDNRRMLPLTIKQNDLPGLSHTNAEVLTYLLQKRSRQYILAADPCGDVYLKLICSKAQEMGI